ncbi:MAG: GIY-YIG nuclease family protein [Candidatus Omnitrophica bacterium]|nr:GIY-YIG nuclease family protein [Candidatus Omnitrophota bacterium]
MTNKTNSVIYTGITSDLVKRIYEHKQKMADGFSKSYNVDKLVYYEVFDDIENAILREKQIKGGSRQRKINLIKSSNAEFRDLYDEIAS